MQPAVPQRCPLWRHGGAPDKGHERAKVPIVARHVDLLAMSPPALTPPAASRRGVGAFS